MNEMKTGESARLWNDGLKNSNDSFGTLGVVSEPRGAIILVSRPRQHRRHGAAAVVGMAAAGLAAFLVWSPWQKPPAFEASECGYYVAGGGEKVRRPCGNWRSGEQKPTGATARCGDGAWSFSRHPRMSGTCSGHGGVVTD